MKPEIELRMRTKVSGTSEGQVMTGAASATVQADLAQQAKDWVEILGEGGYRASRECGCVIPKIKLQIDHRSWIDPNHISHRAELY